MSGKSLGLKTFILFALLIAGGGVFYAGHLHRRLGSMTFSDVGFAPDPDRRLSSIINLTPGRCEQLLGSRPTVFNLTLFERELTRIEGQNGLRKSDVEEALGDPERLLAVIEFQSRTDAYAGFGFKEMIRQLDKKELKLLYKRLAGAMKRGPMTEYTFQELLVTVYRLAHRPRGFVRTVWDNRSLKAAFDKLTDQVILERIELSLFRSGMGRTFDVIITDQGLRAAYGRMMSKYGGWVDTGVALALWGSSVYYMPENAGGSLLTVTDLMPAYLPQFGRFFEVDVNESLLKILREEGLETGMAAARTSLWNQGRRNLMWKYVRATYTTAFSLIFTFTISTEFLKSQQDIQEQDRQQITETIEDGGNITDKYEEFGRMTPQQQGKQSFDEMVAFMRSKGIKVDENSPEMKQELQNRIDMYVRANAKQAAKNKKPEVQ